MASGARGRARCLSCSMSSSALSGAARFIRSRRWSARRDDCCGCADAASGATASAGELAAAASGLPTSSPLRRVHGADARRVAVPAPLHVFGADERGPSLRRRVCLDALRHLERRLVMRIESQISDCAHVRHLRLAPLVEQQRAHQADGAAHTQRQASAAWRGHGAAAPFCFHRIALPFAGHSAGWLTSCRRAAGGGSQHTAHTKTRRRWTTRRAELRGRRDGQQHKRW